MVALSKIDFKALFTRCCCKVSDCVLVSMVVRFCAFLALILAISLMRPSGNLRPIILMVSSSSKVVSRFSGNPLKIKVSFFSGIAKTESTTLIEVKLWLSMRLVKLESSAVNSFLLLVLLPLQLARIRIRSRNLIICAFIFAVLKLY